MLFNATNIKLVVNGFWLNDACSISYQQQASHEPIFGYMDLRYRTVASASGIISGTIGMYYSDYDSFFRYLAAPSGNPHNVIEDFKREEEKYKAAVKNAADAGDMVNLMASTDLNDETFSKLERAAFQNAGLEPPPAPQQPNLRNINFFKSASEKRLVFSDDADVIGKSGWEASYKRMRDTTAGATIDIYYGDASPKVESLQKVFIIGRAKSPIENSPRVGADPVLEYFSFIASHIESK